MSSEANVGLTFEEEISEVPVTIKTKDGTVKKYALREMDGEGLSKWMTLISSRVKRNKAGIPVGDIDYSQFHASLIALCLWDPETNTRVSKEVINGWKASLQNALFAQCRKMNALDDEGANDAKNG